MEKNIWILNNNKNELVEAQHLINEDGALRAICMLSYKSVIKAMDRLRNEDFSIRPSLILIDYETEKKEEFRTLSILCDKWEYAGVPLMFMIENRTKEIDEDCYEKGSAAVVEKPFSISSLRRIERTAWQYEKSRNYEKIMQHQALEITTAREIRRLNEQLESRNKLLYQIFGRYFSNEVMEEILDNPGGTAIGGKKRNLTVMMADLRGFTAITEDLEADVVTDMINYFLGKMTDIIFEYQGSVIEFIGDAILAVFGAPFELANSEENAIAAAIKMQNAMYEVNQYNYDKGYPEIEMGIGINKGEVFIGNIGSEKMMRYNVMGNTVNIASRVENYSVGGQILVSGDTLKNIEEKLEIKNRFILNVKGYSKKLEICEITGIIGKYNCMLSVDLEDEMKEVDNDIDVKLFLVKDKEITKEVYTGKLKYISNKKIKVFIEENQGIELFNDMEISATDEENQGLLINSYGKVVDIKNGLITLHFTFKDKYFKKEGLQWMNLYK